MDAALCKVGPPQQRRSRPGECGAQAIVRLQVSACARTCSNPLSKNKSSCPACIDAEQGLTRMWVSSSSTLRALRPKFGAVLVSPSFNLPRGCSDPIPLRGWRRNRDVKHMSPRLDVEIIAWQRRFCPTAVRRQVPLHQHAYSILSIHTG